MNLSAISSVKPRFKAHKKEETIIYENKLKQQFNPDRPNAVWVSDITYVRAGGKWHYVCVVIDLFGRKLIAWKVSSRPDSALTSDTLAEAMKARNYPMDVLFHSDRGVQYTSSQFRKAADKFEISQSFSAKGHPYDNAVAESFFKFLKLEELNRRTFQTKSELTLVLTAYANWYNSERPHSANNGLSPDQKESLPL
jgi:transposase InsO family protein